MEKSEQSFHNVFKRIAFYVSLLILFFFGFTLFLTLTLSVCVVAAYILSYKFFTPFRYVNFIFEIKINSFL